MTQEENVVSTNETIPTVDTTSSNAPKNKLIPVIVVALVALIILAGGFYYYFSKPSKIVTNIINTAYENFSDIINKDVDFDYKKDSMLITGNLNVDTSIDGLEDLKKEDVAYRVGLDYGNKKVEVGAELKENKKSIINAILYVIDDEAFVSLEDDYDKIIKIDDADFDFSDVFEVTDEMEITNDDVDFIAKEFKDILIESMNMEKLEKSSDTIEVDGKDVKVNKITYNLDEENVEELMENIIDNMLANKDLLKKLSKLSDTDIDDIKDSLKEAKEDAEYEDIGELNIYTKGFMNKVVKIEIEAEDTVFGVNFNKDNSEVYAKEDDTNITLTINEYSDEEVNVDYLIKIDDEKIKGNITATSKEVKDNKYEGKFSFDFEYGEYDFKVFTNYKLEIGAKIANIKTKDAVNYSELDETEMNEVASDILERFEDSALYNIVEDLVENYSYDDDYTVDSDYDSDYSYSTDYDYSY